MSPELQIVVTFVFFLVLLTCGMAVPFAIAVPAIFYLLLQGGLPSLNSLGLVSWGSMNSFVLTCVPLFMLMAEILRVSGLSSRIYTGLAKLVARLPGGLLQTNIAGCAIFASVSGSSIATAASIGGVALPQLISRNYDRRLAAGSLAAGGTLGILLPPSFGMIVYGTFTETSVPKLFMAGVVPGLIMTAAFMTYIGAHALMVPAVAPRESGPRSLQELIVALADVLPFGILIGGTLGGIYAGLVTTTEGATIGCSLAIILGAVFGDLTLRGLIDAMFSTIKFSGNILFIIFTAYIFSYAISFAGVGEKVTAFIVGLHLTSTGIFPGAVHPLHRARLPDREPGHDRDYGAADLSGVAELRHRPAALRRRSRPLRRAWADLAADRNQSVRHTEHLGRQTERSDLRDHPVPSDDVRRAGAGHTVARSRALAASPYVEMRRTGRCSAARREY